MHSLFTATLSQSLAHLGKYRELPALNGAFAGSRIPDPCLVSLGHLPQASLLLEPWPSSSLEARLIMAEGRQALESAGVKLGSRGSGPGLTMVFLPGVYAQHRKAYSGLGSALGTGGTPSLLDLAVYLGHRTKHQSTGRNASECYREH